MIQLSVPWPPSVNRIWRAVAGRIILALVARQYKKQFSAALPTGRVPKPLTGRLEVWLTMNPPDKLAASGKDWDIMNREKILCDCMTKQRVWLDDSQIDTMVITRGSPCPKGRVDVTIHTISEGTGP